MQHVNRSQHLHESGAYAPPSPSAFDPYSTTYSRTHDFMMSKTKAPTYRMPDLPSSGFVHGHKRTNASNTSSRYCGQKLSEQMVKENAYEPMSNHYSRSYSNPQATYLSNTGMQSLTDVAAHNKIVRKTPEQVQAVGSGGYNRNQVVKNVSGGKFMGLSESKQQMQHIPNLHESYRAENPPWTLQKSDGGYLKNSQASFSTKLSAEEALEWMTTTNTAREQASSIAFVEMQAQRDTAQMGHPEASAFSRQIMEPPTIGVGTEQMKLHGSKSRTNHGQKKSPYNTRPYTTTSVELPFKSEKQAYYNMAKLKKKDPVDYNYNLKGASQWSQTSKIGNATAEMIAEHKVPDLPGYAATNAEGSKSEGKYYLKDPSSMYTTTKNIDERFFARYQADISNRPTETSFSSYRSGFSANHKPTLKGQGEGQGPTGIPNLKTGVHLFGEEPLIVGSEKKGYLTSARVVGDNGVPSTSVPPPSSIKRDFVNKNLLLQSPYAREATNPPLPLKALNGGNFSITDTFGEGVPGSLGKIQRDSAPAKSKNWGEGV